MARAIDSIKTKPHWDFLSDFNAEDYALANPASSTAFIEQDADVFENFWEIIYQPANAVQSSRLFISGGKDYHVSV